MKIELKHENGLLFQSKNELGNTLQIGVSNSENGNAIRPMELLLMGIASCSSIDVIGILNKQRQYFKSYRVVVTAERTKAIPAVFKSIHLAFHLSGNILPNKAQYAIDLSIEKYCSVSKILEQTATITTELILNKID